MAAPVGLPKDGGACPDPTDPERFLARCREASRRRVFPVSRGPRRPQHHGRKEERPMSNTKVKPIPDGMHTLTPHLVCADAVAAIEFYKKALGAAEMGRLLGSRGKI